MTTCTQVSDLIQEHDIDVLLIGFPKCGTTAFADWLSNCPQVDVSAPKETFLLCPEFANNLERSAFRDADLGACFSGEKRDGVLRMEASTLNVYSPSLLSAVADIKRVKCVALTRDPVQTTLSWHNQVINAGFHASADFVESWEFGNRVNATEGQEFLKRYYDVASYGHWCEKWLDCVGHERLLLLDANDLRKSPALVKSKLEGFLGSSLDVAPSLPERNKFAEPRSKFLYDAIRGSRILKAFRSLEQHLQILADIRRTIRDKVILKPAKKEIRTDVESMLRAAFKDDQSILAELTAQNADTWN